MHSNDTILVIGGTGKTGRRVAERLTARGVPVRIGSRGSQPAFDWDDPATWPAAIEGTTAAYVAFAPDLALPGAAAAVREVARLASDAGLRRLVLLSGRGEEEALRAEAEVRSAFPGVTVLRCSFFAQNFTEGAFAPDVQAGELALPVGDVREPFIDADDIADAAVAALLEDGHEGELYELTGPRLLTFAEAVGDTARVRSVPMAEFTAGLASVGLGKAEIALLEYLFGEVLDGRNASVTDGVQQRARPRAARRRGDGAMSGAVAALVIVAAVGAACTGGVLFAFSSFVMPALRRLPAGAGRGRDAVHQRHRGAPAVHARVRGTAVLSVALVVVALTALDEPYAPWLIVAAVLYLVGVFGLTMAYHVPRNDALAALAPDAPETAVAWGRYVAEWTTANHVRSAAGLLAAAALAIALRVG